VKEDFKMTVTTLANYLRDHRADLVAQLENTPTNVRDAVTYAISMVDVQIAEAAKEISK